MKDLLDFPLPEKLSEITYVANYTDFRRSLLNKYGRPDLDTDHEIATNPDTKLTYLTLGENRTSNGIRGT